MIENPQHVAVTFRELVVSFRHRRTTNCWFCSADHRDRATDQVRYISSGKHSSSGGMQDISLRGPTPKGGQESMLPCTPQSKSYPLGVPRYSGAGDSDVIGWGVQIFAVRLQAPLLLIIPAGQKSGVAGTGVMHGSRDAEENIACLGLSFKPGTDGLRESLQVQPVKRPFGEGCEVEIWDENVSLGASSAPIANTSSRSFPTSARSFVRI